jgi:hypothetical protein
MPISAPSGSGYNAWARPEVQPLLLWLVNNWAVVAPKLDAAVAKLNRANEVFLVDVRIDRGDAMSTLDPATVFDKGVAVELEGLRQVLSNHPFLYTSAWCKQLALQTKQEVKAMATKSDPVSVGKGVLVCFARGDIADLEKILPDFTMNVAQARARPATDRTRPSALCRQAALCVRRQAALCVRRTGLTWREYVAWARERGRGSVGA